MPLTREHEALLGISALHTASSAADALGEVATRFRGDALDRRGCIITTAAGDASGTLRSVAKPSSPIVAALTAFYFDQDYMKRPPSGKFEAGAKVVLLARDRDQCWVADGGGALRAHLCDGLKKTVAIRGG